MRRRVLVLGAVHARGGPEAKMRGLAAGFERLGCATTTLLITPGPQAVDALRDALHGLDHRPDLVLVRSHWTLPPLLPTLRRWQRQGTRLVIDAPTPTAAGMREIARSDRSLPERAVRACVEALWIPAASPSADLVVQYDVDGWPWRTLARRRRLTLTNGIDVAARPLAPDWKHRTSMSFVAVGATGQWHGIDRLLRGLADAPEVDACLTVVGDGPELGRLRRRAEAWRVGHRVRFTGVLTGAPYDAAMAAADVGVASLGEHRRGGFSLSPLRTRDYLARGLPVIFAGDDPDLRGDRPFTWRCPDNDTAIDVPAAHTWLTALRRDHHSTPATIREFACAQLDHRQRAERILTAVGLAEAPLVTALSG